MGKSAINIVRQRSLNDINHGNSMFATTIYSSMSCHMHGISSLKYLQKIHDRRLSGAIFSKIFDLAFDTMLLGTSCFIDLHCNDTRVHHGGLIDVSHNPLYQLCHAWPKRAPFRKRHVKMHFNVWKF